eukprot:6667385-Ditylum_brightwellii.AAC.1
MNGDIKILSCAVFPLTSTFNIALDTPPILKSTLFVREIIGANSCIDSNARNKNGCLVNTPIASVLYFCFTTLTNAVPVQGWINSIKEFVDLVL